ncbi:MAG: OmpA family protein, partial [Longimicrobiaceae bacterium]
MKLRQLLILALIPLALGACRRRAPAVVPGTDTEVTDVSARDRARADSIAAFEATERERQARLRSGEMARAREVLTDIVYFEYDSYELGMDAQDRLREKAEILRANPGIRLRIEGHADERGSTEYNLALGQRRAE